MNYYLLFITTIEGFTFFLLFLKFKFRFDL